jgi:hypothetical protein
VSISGGTARGVSLSAVSGTALAAIADVEASFFLSTVKTVDAQNCEAAAFLTMSGAASLGGLDPASLDPASLGGLDSASLDPASLDTLDTAGWKCNEDGEIKNGEPQCKEEYYDLAAFKHSQSLEAENVWRMKVGGGRSAQVGIAAEVFDVERNKETYESTARVILSSGSTFIHPDISKDGEDHYHHRLLEDHIPDTLPYDLALRINKDGNMPQLRFNEDGQWHDFAHEGGTGLKAGPWFPYLYLQGDDRLSDHRVNRPRPVKGAGMNKSLAPSAAPASDSAGAAAGNVDDSFLPPQKKAQHEEAGGSK